MEIHFINVGIGNMTLLTFPNGITYLYDCNVTDENESDVGRYLRKAMGTRRRIDAFICSHRDADHMRGVKRIHATYPFQAIWDAGVEGTSTDTSEYAAYMDLRRRVTSRVINARTYDPVGSAIVRWMNSHDDDLSDANDQSIVMKIEYGGSSALLTGDTSFRPWKEKIEVFYADSRIRSSILLAAHHGSISFFDDPADERYYYVSHLKKIKPEMTLVSVGPNVHGLPNAKAIELYEKYSSGSDRGNKLYRTDRQGNMRLTLKDVDGWSLSVNQ